jgi:hypothetical protein
MQKGILGKSIVGNQLAYAPGTYMHDAISRSVPELKRLPDGWVSGRSCDLGGLPGQTVRVDYVLMHPRLGVALIELGKLDGDAEDVLRRRLTEARFSAIFPGHLPILHGSVDEAELPSLTEILVEEFAGLPPVSLAGGDAWVEAMGHIVVPADGIWTDSREGASAGLSGRHPRRSAGSSPARIVPLRLVHPAPPSGVQSPSTEEDEAEELVWQEERSEQDDTERAWTRGAAESVATLAAVALVAVAVAVGWESGPYDRPHIPPALPPASVAPAQELVQQVGPAEAPETMVARDKEQARDAETIARSGSHTPMAPAAILPERPAEPVGTAEAPLPLPPPAPPKRTERTVTPSTSRDAPRAVRYRAGSGDRGSADRAKVVRATTKHRHSAHR